MSNTGACPGTNEKLWVASASYTATCPNQDEMLWGWMPSGTKTISGAVLLRYAPTLDFLVLHDFSAPIGIRFSILQFLDGVLSDNNGVEWVGSTPPGSNLEGLARFSENLFMAVTGFGDVYVMALNWNSSQISVADTATLPLSGDITDEIEGFAIRELFGKKIVVWATRGDTGPSQLLYGEMASDGTVTSYIATIGNAIEFTVPFPITDARSCGALYIAADGSVYTSATSDAGDDGPFSSAIYKIGALAAGGLGAVFTLDLVPTEIYRTLNHKTEAIMQVDDDSTGLGLILGSDDENRGGSIYLQRAPIARHITITRTGRSYISQQDARNKAVILARREAHAALHCYQQGIQSVPPLCAGDYYAPVSRNVWADDLAVANAAALAGATLAAEEFCSAGFDQEPPPIVDGFDTADVKEVLVDELRATLIDELVSPFQNE